MWSNCGMRLIAFIGIFIPGLLFCQAKENEKFDPEKILNFKIGTTLNFTNVTLFKLLNTSGSDVFTADKSMCFNPSADIEFENHFSKYIGITIDLGFMQTRNRYHYTNAAAINSVNPPNYRQDGVILCNIPHLNISPSFYINNTRFYFGFGLYKYYYLFNPMSVGNLYFDLNSESLLIYSNIGVTESFDIKNHRFTVSVNYFGPIKRFDNGFQLAVGIAL